MDTTSRQLEDNKCEITVTLTIDEVQKEIDAAYKKAGKNRIPGFRQGKAPRKILENYFGGKEYFLAEATEELVEKYSPLAPDEMDIVPLGSADYGQLGLAVEGEPFSFSFTFDVAPKFELSSYEPVQIEFPSTEPTPEELQAQTDALLSYYASQDDEGNQINPQLTDEWVQETLEFDSVEAFNERLAESIRYEKTEQYASFKDMLINQELAKRLVGEVPEQLIKQTEQDNYRDLFNNLQHQQTTLDAYMEAYGYTSESFRESIHEQAVLNASIALALDAWARHLELSINEADVRAEFEQSGAKDPDQLYEDWRQNGRLAELRQGIARMRASEDIYAKLEIFALGELHPAPEESEAEPTEALAAEEKPRKKTKKESTAKKPDETQKTSPKKPRTKAADTKKSTSSDSEPDKIASTNSKKGKEEK